MGPLGGLLGGGGGGGLNLGGFGGLLRTAAPIAGMFNPLLGMGAGALGGMLR